MTYASNSLIKLIFNKIHPRQQIFGEVLSEEVKSFFIKHDIIDHVSQVGIDDLDDLFDIMPFFRLILSLDLYLGLGGFRDFQENLYELFPIVQNCSKFKLQKVLIFLLT